MGSRSDLRPILQANIERRIVRDEQLAIRMRVFTLSENARQVLNIGALYGTSAIPQKLLKEAVGCIL